MFGNLSLTEILVMGAVAFAFYRYSIYDAEQKDGSHLMKAERKKKFGLLPVALLVSGGLLLNGAAKGKGDSFLGNGETNDSLSFGNVSVFELALMAGLGYSVYAFIQLKDYIGAAACGVALGFSTFKSAKTTEDITALSS